MLLNDPAQLPQMKPKVPSPIVRRNSKQIQSLLPSHNLAIDGPTKISLNSFHDAEYLQRLLTYQDENFEKINTSKTRFFPLGSNDSHEIQGIMVYIGQKENKTQFCKLTDFTMSLFR